MPRYDFTCREGHTTEERRPVARRSEPGVCPTCQGETTAEFTITRNIFIPIRMQMVREGGILGGGSLSFEDVHGVTSVKQLLKEHPDYEPYNRVMSRPGAGKKKPAPPDSKKFADAFRQAKAEVYPND